MEENWYLSEVRFGGSTDDDCYLFDLETSTVEVILRSTNGKTKLIDKLEYKDEFDELLWYLFFTNYGDLDINPTVLFPDAVSSPDALAVNKDYPILSGAPDKLVFLARSNANWDGLQENHLMTLDIKSGVWSSQSLGEMDDLEELLMIHYLKTEAEQSSESWEFLCGQWLNNTASLRWGRDSNVLFLRSPYQVSDCKDLELELHWVEERWRLIEIRQFTDSKEDQNVNIHSLRKFKLSNFIDLHTFCMCTNTYREFRPQIKPYPERFESYLAIKDLCQNIIDPVVDYFGKDRFQLTYGFCSKDLKKYLRKKNPETGKPYGRVSPDIDQHMAMEFNANGKLFCKHEGAACDFKIYGLTTDKVIDWIIEAKLPFDMIYYYGPERPVHISFGPKNRRGIYTFLESGPPTKRGCEKWIDAVKHWNQRRFC